jgi:hypothetical protein
VNSYRDQDVRRALHPLAVAADETGAAWIGLRHLNKDGANSNALYRGGGSIGISGQARAVHLAAHDPDDTTGDRRVFAPVKMNNAKLPPPLGYRLIEDATERWSSVEWLGPDPHTAGELLGLQLEADERADRDEVVWWLESYLQSNSGAAAYHDILAASRRHGIAERTLKRARARAGIRYVREGWQSGTIWQLPASGPSGPSGPPSQ